MTKGGRLPQTLDGLAQDLSRSNGPTTTDDPDGNCQGAENDCPHDYS